MCVFFANFATDNNNKLMVRVFHRRITPTGTAGVLLLAAVSLACFWQHTGTLAAVGAIVAATSLVGIERMLHTTYTLADSRRLVIDKGRLSRPVIIDTADITAVRHGRGGLTRTPHVVISRRGAADVIVYPDDGTRFTAAVREAMQQETADTEKA